MPAVGALALAWLACGSIPLDVSALPERSEEAAPTGVGYNPLTAACVARAELGTPRNAEKANARE